MSARELTAGQLEAVNAAASTIAATVPFEPQNNAYYERLDAVIPGVLGGNAGTPGTRRWVDVRLESGRWVGRWVGPGEGAGYAAIHCALSWQERVTAAGDGLKDEAAAAARIQERLDSGDMLALLGWD